jgi:hypothetical protein
MSCLPCAGKLGNCNIGKSTAVMKANPSELKHFHFTCLYCRWRRALKGKWTNPAFIVKYTYRNHQVTYLTKEYVVGNLAYYASDGSPLQVTLNYTLEIDPRGHFTNLRYAAIIILDKMIKLFRWKKPFVEFAEFLSNYPTW